MLGHQRYYSATASVARSLKSVFKGPQFRVSKTALDPKNLGMAESSQSSVAATTADLKGKAPRKGEARTPNAKKKDPAPRTGQQAVSTKLRGLPKDSPDVRISKTLSYLLRHGAEKEGLKLRTDGYIKVDDLLQNPKLKSQLLTLDQVKEIVKADAKQRYDLILETPEGQKLKLADTVAPVAGVEDTAATSSSTHPTGTWWIKANQGHSIKTVQLELQPIHSLADVPSGIVVHGTTRAAWKLIAQSGLSKMNRNHIHLAQDVTGKGVVSGMRNSSQVLIFINLTKALEAGLKFFLSDNGVVLTEGDERGFLDREFFDRVEDSKGTPITGWKESPSS
ncbi:hypothetical protein CVT24_007523 [Panaeolus cyanescens]|uniref:2'-phosphotransferase n=1 Tax=Panaeolus cyanescens TaxID=181874 RepID=A0A409YL48_9AGAR|nr:hypothetical protein CVT24_007523 [Panaeolus cyanescens]